MAIWHVMVWTGRSDVWEYMAGMYGGYGKLLLARPQTPDCRYGMACYGAQWEIRLQVCKCLPDVAHKRDFNMEALAD